MDVAWIAKRWKGWPRVGKDGDTFIDIDGPEAATKRPSSSSLLCQDIQTAIYMATCMIAALW